jgi:predicted transposase YdaD
MAQNDEYSRITVARTEGMEKGMEKGIVIGRQEGILEGMEKGVEKGIGIGMEEGMEKGIGIGMEKGMEKGKLEKAMDIALMMLGKGIDLKLIAECTGLPEEDIASLRGLRS